jgi:hypothetical protein
MTTDILTAGDGLLCGFSSRKSTANGSLAVLLSEGRGFCAKNSLTSILKKFLMPCGLAIGV